MLCIMAALFCTGMGLKKRQPAEPELPKIAETVTAGAAAPEQPEAASTAAEAEPVQENSNEA